MRDGRVVRFAAISCVHCPYHDVDAHANLLAQIREFKPQVFVLLGDLFESEAASVHPRDVALDITEEYAVAGQYLLSLRDVCGGECDYVWILGNHDDNLQAPDPRRVPKALRKAVHWNRDYDWGSEFRRWKQIPYVKGREGCYELGQVIFYHGFDSQAGSDRTECIQMSNACGGHAHRLGIRGHTHRPLPVTQVSLTSKVPLAYWYANPGTMGPKKPGYMARKDSSQWGSGVILGESLVARPSRMRQGPQWSAELVRL